MLNCDDAFIPLQGATFYPALLEGDLSDDECELFIYQQVLLAWGSITQQRLHRYPITSLSPGTIGRARQALEEIARKKFYGVVLALLSPGQLCAIRRTVQGSGTIQRRPCPALHLICMPNMIIVEINTPTRPKLQERDLLLHHNEIRDCIGDVASQMWPLVIKE